MVIYLMLTTINSYGGGDRAMTVLQEFLTASLGNYGAGLREIHVNLYAAVTPRQRASWRGQFAPKQEAAMAGLPRLRFVRSRERFELSYETRAVDADAYDESKGSPVPTAAGVRALLAELVEHLSVFGGRVKKSDAIDFEAFIRDVRDCASRLPGREEELLALEHRQQQARHMAPSMTAEVGDPLAGIEWRDYHLRALELMPDEVLWSEIHDESPHGCDTGSDTLDAFRAWNARNKEKMPSVFVAGLLKRWSMAADAVFRDEVWIATAFASVKMRGCCDAESKREALAAITRRDAKHGHSEISDIMSRALKAAPEVRA